MAYWLLKSEPDVYSYDDLARDKKTEWDGVANNTALKHIRSMHKGDLALIYHTGDERTAVGIAEIISEPHPDPKLSDEKMVVITIKPKKKLARPVTLAEIKSDPAFAGWDLLRIGRLSVVPTSEKMWKHIEKLADQPAKAPPQKDSHDTSRHRSHTRAGQPPASSC
jgi:predicted RNA-binding protein with PUA-like domain